MVTAYVMIKALTADADRLRKDIGAIDGVVDVSIVAGDVDLIAKLDVESPANVKDITADHIHRVEGVDTTETYIGMD